MDQRLERPRLGCWNCEEQEKQDPAFFIRVCEQIGNTRANCEYQELLPNNQLVFSFWEDVQLFGSEMALSLLQEDLSEREFCLFKLKLRLLAKRIRAYHEKQKEESKNGR